MINKKELIPTNYDRRSFNNQPTIRSEASRAFDRERDRTLCLLDINQPLFKRLLILQPDITQNILFQSHFKVFLTLRLVSKELYVIALRVLSQKAVISFLYTQLYPYTDDFLIEKFKFSQQRNFEVRTIISIEELSNLSSTNHSFSDISNKKLKLILEINNTKKIEQLQSLLLDASKTDLLNKITSLDLSKITIKTDTLDSIDQLLTLLVQNLNFLTSLTHLFLGDIDADITFKLSNKLNNCTSISIQNIQKNATLNLSDSLPNLKNCSIHNIADNVTLNLPNSFTQLSIDEIHSDSTLKLPNLLPDFTDLFIRKINIDTVLQLANSLTNLSIQTIDTSASFELSLKPVPDDFNTTPKLTNLSIEEINDTASIALPTLTNLTTFSIEKSAAFAINLNCYPNLTSLFVNQIPHGLETLNQLTNLAINCDSTWPLLPPTLKSLSIGSIQYEKGLLNLPISLTSLKIHKIEDHSIIELPLECQGLTSLYIGNIPSKLKLTFPGSFPNLTSLDIGQMRNKVIFKLPGLCNNLITLCIQEICHIIRKKNNHPIKPILKLPDSLISLKIEKINNNVTINPLSNPTYNNLESIFISNIGPTKFELSNLFNKLKTLTLENIADNASLTLPGLKNIKKLQIINLSDSVTLKFAESLDTLNVETIDNSTFINNV